MNSSSEIAIPRQPLGIAALDTLLGGGLPEGNCLLVQGAPGTGKTLLGMQFLYEGATRFDAPGLLVTFEEAPCRLFRDARALGWDFERLAGEGRLQIVYTSPTVFLKELEADHYGRFCRDHGIRRILVDNLSVLDSCMAQAEGARTRSLRMVNGLRQDDLMVMLLRESVAHAGPFPVTPDEYVADTIIQLEYRAVAGRRVRLLEILKNRGSAHSEACHRFVIAPSGLQIDETLFA
ncbi:MAG: DUF2075 domain-containing protein [Armatimonadota bacterium]|nr:DUF2075 domain-containing protein [Armatimonadota bacterium]